MNIILYHPEIPPNTGNIARLCAATCTRLHLIEPLGFSIDDRAVRRAGLDYWPHVPLSVWPDWDSFRHANPDLRLVLTSARQGEPVHRFAYQAEDALVFGPETTGLPDEIFALSPHRVRIPIWGKVRSLNLSTSAGIVLYQALACVGMLEEK